MNMARKLSLFSLAILTTAAYAQVPDMVDAMDAGGRAMGAGSALNLTGVSTLSATYNPAALAYASRREIGVAMRTLPNSNSIVTGAVNDLQSETTSETGGFKATHLGVIWPMGNGSSIGAAWTIGGWMHDTQRGVNLANGVATFFDFTRAQTDFFNLSYGHAGGGDQQLAWGAGLILARQHVKTVQNITFTDPNIPPQTANTDTSANGYGAQIGVMLTPKSNPDLTIAASARTPIEIQDGDPIYETIPGRIAAGFAIRKSGFRGGRDFLVMGVEGQYFFGGEDSPRIDRENHGTAHFGAEYNYTMGNAVIPIRVGYSIVPAGGDGFGNRNTFTYGFGYRPHNGDWTIEVNFGNPQGGGRETGIYLSYRFGN